MLQYLIFSMILIPIIGFLFSLIIKQDQENAISRLALFTGVIEVILSIMSGITWFFQENNHFHTSKLIIFNHENYTFALEYFFDDISITYSFVGSVLLSLVMAYSRLYLHREKGYKRFFNTLLWFDPLLFGQFRSLLI